MNTCFASHHTYINRQLISDYFTNCIKIDEYAESAKHHRK